MESIIIMENNTDYFVVKNMDNAASVEGEKRCIINFNENNKGNILLRSFFAQSFQKVRECVEVRLKESSEGNRLETVCKQVPVDLDEDHDFYHRWKQDNYAHHLYGKKLYLSLNDQCTLFTSEDGSTVNYTVQEKLCSSQEETGAKIILCCFHASQSCQNKLPIRIRLPDTNVFMVLLSYANEIENVLLFDTGVENKRRVINIINISGN
ncbi:unnamed protein product [Psylliodes chrysocephalus]|uniref:Uncharacterized protein n=1 Tax=Psylliodes chrysocephalus TaxID=3402493 RepID=A0A9P0DDL8_9CUCU|nr:unnamed protein product [Psylliodes chrysocephala]